MKRTTCLMAALALGAGLAAAAAAQAQSQGDSGPPPASAQPAPPPTAPSTGAPVNPADPNAGQPTYSVPPPADNSSGIYLPAVVGGYVKSTTGCVVVGCDNGPDVDGSSGVTPPGADETPALPPANPGPSSQH